jgi:hypothetical protein
MRELYGKTPAAEFGPVKLKAVRQRMIDSKLCRSQISFAQLEQAVDNLAFVPIIPCRAQPAHEFWKRTRPNTANHPKGDPVARISPLAFGRRRRAADFHGVRST